jgi:hypothetical protein
VIGKATDNPALMSVFARNCSHLENRLEVRRPTNEVAPLGAISWPVYIRGSRETRLREGWRSYGQLKFCY